MFAPLRIPPDLASPLEILPPDFLLIPPVAAAYCNGFRRTCCGFRRWSFSFKTDSAGSCSGGEAIHA